MKFSLFGTKIEVTFLFAAVLCLMLLTDKAGLFLPVFAAVLLHESGHLFVMYLVGSAPVSVKLIPASVKITKKVGTKSRHEIAVLLCGPVLNLLAFSGLYLNFFLYNKTRVLEYAAAQLIFAVFNLLPVKGLDGGSVLYILISKRRGINAAERVLFAVSLAFAAAFGFFALYGLLRGQFNISLIITALYIAVCTVTKY